MFSNALGHLDRGRFCWGWCRDCSEPFGAAEIGKGHVGFFLRHDMGIGPEGQFRVGVAQLLSNPAQTLACSQGTRRVGVPRTVQAQWTHTLCLCPPTHPMPRPLSRFLASIGFPVSEQKTQGGISFQPLAIARFRRSER
jgi:hypothetical protein